jgi:hypothetical protein
MMATDRKFFLAVFALVVTAMLALAAYGYFSGAWDRNVIPPPPIAD